MGRVAERVRSGRPFGNGVSHPRLEPDDLEQTWSTYRTSEDIEARNSLMLHYGSLVRYIAYKAITGLPSNVEREDLVSYGQFGLLKALRSFDVSRGVKFETFAGPRIKGQILDELRTLDWVPRSVRSKTRDVGRATEDLHASLGRSPEDGELADHLGVSVPELWGLQSQAHVSGTVHTIDDGSWASWDRESSLSGPLGGDIMCDPLSAPEDRYDVSELGDILGEAIHSLAERDKMILALCYLEEMTLSEVGAILGVTESRVSQLQGRVLQELRERLGRQVFVAA